MFTVASTDEFDDWFAAQDEDAKVEVVAVLQLLKQYGPRLSRPHADTLNGSKYANMKELRIRMPKAAIRVAFAFDPRRKAVLLVAGDKSGVSEKRFYRQLIAKADALYQRHLEVTDG